MKFHSFSKEHLSNAIEVLLTDLGTETANEVLSAFRRNDFHAIRSMNFPSVDVLDHDGFRRDWLALSLLRKAVLFSEPANVRRSAAIQKWKEGELKCAETNIRLSGLCPRNEDAWFNPILHRATRLVASVLGKIPSNLLDYGYFGPGVSSSCTGDTTSGYNKLLAVPEVTPSLRNLGAVAISSVTSWASCVLDAKDEITGSSLSVSVLPRALKLVAGNKVTVVPKDPWCDRTISIEPTVNGWIQGAIGTHIFRRLKRVGIDLRDQTRNQELARLGSNGTEPHATLDLANASNTISIELVRLLVPAEWFSLLDASRSQYGNVDGEWVRYQMFSSMGNGFTFPLESLLFWALTRATCDHFGQDDSIVSVYGDDIVAPCDLVEPLIKIFDYCGFEINAKKSFWDLGSRNTRSFFRESCGKEYYLGYDVTPFRIRKCPSSIIELQDFANLIRRAGLANGDSNGMHPSFIRMHAYVVACLPAKYRVYGPPSVSGVIHCTWEEAGTYQAIRRHGMYEGVLVRRLTQQAKTVTPLDLVAMTWFSLSTAVRGFLTSQGDGSPVPVIPDGAPTRGRVPRRRAVGQLKWITTHVCGWDEGEA